MFDPLDLLTRDDSRSPTPTPTRSRDDRDREQSRTGHRRTYHGAVGKQLRYFALKLPIAADAKTATFGYIDPGNNTDTELRSWGAAHEWLWRALRGKGIKVQVVAIGLDFDDTIRSETALKRWSKGAGGRANKQWKGRPRTTRM